MMAQSKDSAEKLRYFDRRVRPDGRGRFVSTARVIFGKRSKMFTGEGATPIEAMDAVTKAAEVWAHGQ